MFERFLALALVVGGFLGLGAVLQAWGSEGAQDPLEDGREDEAPAFASPLEEDEDDRREKGDDDREREDKEREKDRNHRGKGKRGRD